ncbi:MAG TPA: hypothetical protein VMV17_18610, partial [Streptosporangiaceae bacterium]|nr:hypothetical protein [Streptosporangiaceae bacterium]
MSYKQAVLVIRWLPGATRVRQLAAGNAIGKTTACVRLHQGIDVLAAQAPNLHASAPAGGARERLQARPRPHHLRREAPWRDPGK